VRLLANQGTGIILDWKFGITTRRVRRTYAHRRPAAKTTVSEETYSASTSSSTSSTFAWSSTRTSSVGVSSFLSYAGPLLGHLHPRFPDSSGIAISTYRLAFTVCRAGMDTRFDNDPICNVDPLCDSCSGERFIVTTERHRTIVLHTPAYGSPLRP
jgi:hypothetical protein